MLSLVPFHERVSNPPPPPPPFRSSNRNAALLLIGPDPLTNQRMPLDCNSFLAITYFPIVEDISRASILGSPRCSSAASSRSASRSHPVQLTIRIPTPTEVKRRARARMITPEQESERSEKCTSLKKVITGSGEVVFGTPLRIWIVLSRGLQSRRRRCIYWLFSSSQACLPGLRAPAF